jgi:hypothetical protein
VCLGLWRRKAESETRWEANSTSSGRSPSTVRPEKACMQYAGHNLLGVGGACWAHLGHHGRIVHAIMSTH